MAGSHEDRSDFYGLHVECMSSARKKKKVQLAGRQKKRHNVLLTVLLAAYIPTYISRHSNGRHMPRLTFMMTEGKQDHTTRDEVSLLLQLPNRSVNFKVTDRKAEGYR